MSSGDHANTSRTKLVTRIQEELEHVTKFQELARSTPVVLNTILLDRLLFGLMHDEERDRIIRTKRRGWALSAESDNAIHISKTILRPRGVFVLGSSLLFSGTSRSG